MLALELTVPMLMIIGGMGVFIVGVIQLAVKRLTGVDRILVICGAVGTVAGVAIMVAELGDAAGAILSLVLVFSGLACLLTGVIRYSAKAKAADREQGGT